MNNILCKPTYLCIGVQKSGTTSLISYMNIHPEIYMNPKELHFFDMYELNNENIKNYESKFKPGEKKIIGEKTPSYCYLQFAIDRIYSYNPNMKLILILREPISRAYSQFNMDHPDILDEFISYVLENSNNLKDIKSNGEYYIERGYYDEHIEYILKKFPPENLYVGIAEEIKLNKNEEYNKIFKFLGGSELIINDDKDTHVRSYEKLLDKNDAKILYEIYKPHNERLYNILGRKIDIWEKYYENLFY